MSAPGRGDEFTVGDLERLLDESFPFAWAEPWDRCGLLVGDPSTPVTRVYVTLDPTRAAISEAVAAGANALVSHHPPFLDPPAAFTSADPSSAVAFEAASMGVALLACHTDLDRAPAGAAALPLALGLEAGEPLERSRQTSALVTVYVPGAAASRVIDAMTTAGGGRVGEYRGCAFTDPGVGSFVPGEGTHPFIGEVGVRSSAEELRVEMTCDPAALGRVLAAARRAHPYEEPLVLVTEIAIDRGSARLGRLSRLATDESLSAFATRVARALGITPRVWGDPDSEVSSVATASGSGGSLVVDALAAGASVLVTGEVRYHVALEAVAGGLTVIEAGHDATEWPLVGVLAGALRRHPALVERVVQGEPSTGWWVAREGTG